MQRQQMEKGKTQEQEPRIGTDVTVEGVKMANSQLFDLTERRIFGSIPTPVVQQRLREHTRFYPATLAKQHPDNVTVLIEPSSQLVSTLQLAIHLAQRNDNPTGVPAWVLSIVEGIKTIGHLRTPDESFTSVFDVNLKGTNFDGKTPTEVARELRSQGRSLPSFRQGVLRAIASPKATSERGILCEAQVEGGSTLYVGVTSSGTLEPISEGTEIDGYDCPSYATTPSF